MATRWTRAVHTRTHEQLIPQKTCKIKEKPHFIHDIINYLLSTGGHMDKYWERKEIVSWEATKSS